MKAKNNKKAGLLKKGFLVLSAVLLLSIISPSANAQVGFAIGPKGGASINSFKGTSPDELSTRVGYLGGIFANLHLGEVFSIQPELLIHQKGGSVMYSGKKNEVKLNYFSVPVLFKFSVPIQSTFYPHVFAGPVYNYRLNAKYTSTEGRVAFENGGDLRRSEIAGAVGTGLDIVTNNIFINLDARYNLGFTDLSKQNISLKNRSFAVALGVGYRFGSPK